MAVDPAFRKCGIAKALVENAIHSLHDEGIFELYLLTTTAEEYASKFGFVTIPRSEMPAILLERSLLGCACPSTSVCMKLNR
jgi:N-acetylglutamate synthase-like GNAT family acetyltransferase